MVAQALSLMEGELLRRQLEKDLGLAMTETAMVLPDKHPGAKYLARYAATGMADVVILPYLDPELVAAMSLEHLRKLYAIVQQMTQYRPFPVVSIHDQFAAHPNNLNWVRYWYKELLAELAESRILDDILSQLHGKPGTYVKRSPDLAKYIRQSNYALC